MFGGNVFQGFNKTITIYGSFFTPNTSVNCDGVTVNSSRFIDSQSIEVNVTAKSVLGIFDLSIDNGKKTVVSDAIEIKDLADSLVDLRSGGTEFSDAAIAMRSGMSFIRTPDGLYFTGINPWSSWARFVGDNREWIWDRGDKKTISWIFINTAAIMLGIGSEETNSSSTTQYREAEIVGYFNASSFNGFYGNSGTPGSPITQAQSFAFSAAIKKLVLSNNGEPGSRYSLYQLPSADFSDWFDTNNLIGTGIINNNMTADAEAIMPFVVPRDGGSSLFLGFILE